MAADLTLLNAMTGKGIDNSQLPYIGSNVETAPSAGFAQRNLALQQILSQLLGPSFESLYEAGPTDQAAGAFKQAGQARRSEAQRRGLSASGAVPTAERGARSAYQSQIANIVGAGSQMETSRVQQLLAQLASLIQSDVGAQNMIRGGVNAGRGASAADTMLALNQNLSMAKGAGTIAAILAGGAAGAAGGAGGAAAGTGSAAGYGALAGNAISNQLWGQGGSAPLASMGTSTPQQGNQTPSGYSNLVPEATGYSAYGPYSGGYQFQEQAGGVY